MKKESFRELAGVGVMMFFIALGLSVILWGPPRIVEASPRAAMQGFGYSYAHITTASTEVMDGSGVLRSITINGPASSSLTLTIYDNTEGSGSDIISVITIPTSVLNPMPVTLSYNIRCGTGIYVKESNTSTYDVTVAYSRD